MTATATVERSTFTGDGGTPARRAVMRWAWRLFRREWRQQLIVLTLIVVAVTVTILGAAVETNVPPPANAGFGTANHLVTLPGTSPDTAAELAAIGRRFGTVDVIDDQPLDIGLAQPADLRAQDPNGAFGRPMLELVSGRYPRGADEVALTPPLADALGLGAGGVWRAGDRSLRIVGTVRNPQNLLDSFALLAPGQLTTPNQVTVLFDATTATLSGFAFPSGSPPVTPAVSSGISPAVIVFAISLIGLIFIGLVASAGFAVLAHRRLRALGVLTALGATDHNVRLVLVANGTLVGAVGSVLGAVLGLGAWIAYAPELQVSAHHTVTWTNVPWWLVIATMVLATVTATLAARRPAKAVTRIPAVAALSGRPPAVAAVHKSAIPGAVILTVATLMLAFSGGWGGNGGRDTLFQLGGLVGSAVGLLLLAPFTISLLSSKARRVPIATRIALRDLARYRSRSGAALGASSFAVLIAMLVTLITTGRYADPVDYFGPNLAADQLLVQVTSGSDGQGAPNPPRQQQATAGQTAAVNTIAASLNSTNVLPLKATDAFMGVRVGSGGFRGGGATIYLATPALLSHYGIDPASIDPATMLITSRAGLEATKDLALVAGGDTANPTIVGDPRVQTETKLPTDVDAPNLLVTERAVAALGLHVEQRAWMIQAPGTLTSRQVNTARQIAVAAGLTVESKSQAPSLATVRNDATYAGALLALGILAMTIGLIRGEASGELRTLAATGASSRTRRTITAATAGILGLLSAILGTAVAYLTSVAFFRSQLSVRLGHPPTLNLILILVGLPVLATAGGWLFAGRQPAGIAHQPIE
jgi:putative ABC transport system permease protein